MAKYKHLTLSERVEIYTLQKANKSIRKIAKELKRDPTTISKEIKKHLEIRETGCGGRPFNQCKKSDQCLKSKVCGAKYCMEFCYKCEKCKRIVNCTDYGIYVGGYENNGDYTTNWLLRSPMYRNTGVSGQLKNSELVLCDGRGLTCSALRRADYTAAGIVPALWINL